MPSASTGAAVSAQLRRELQADLWQCAANATVKRCQVCVVRLCRSKRKSIGEAPDELFGEILGLIYDGLVFRASSETDP